VNDLTREKGGGVEENSKTYRKMRQRKMENEYIKERKK
jgi:hypothetical protein